MMKTRQHMKRSRPTIRVSGWTLAALLCLVAPASTQQPTFKVSVNVVDVDVTVKDAQGNFVTGLTADDFEVFEDGKPQTIQTFSYIELPAQPRTSFSFGGRAVPNDVRSNRDVESEIGRASCRERV